MTTSDHCGPDYTWPPGSDQVANQLAALHPQSKHACLGCSYGGAVTAILRDRERVQDHRASLLIQAQRLISERGSGGYSVKFEELFMELMEIVACIREQIHGG